MSKAIGVFRRWGLAVLVAGGLAAPAWSQDFKVAMSSPPTSMDPHFQNITTNANVIEHMFEPLVMRSPDGKLAPGLAESWSLINNLTWEFKIRRGAKFSDGSLVTAEDVVASWMRWGEADGAGQMIATFLAGLDAVDAKTLRVRLKEPFPQLPYVLAKPMAIPMFVKPGNPTLAARPRRDGRLDLEWTSTDGQTKISAACRKLPKLRKIRMKMNTSAIGTMMASRSRARCRFSNCPPNPK